MKELSDLPNIGNVLAQRLKEVGIETVEDLEDLGSEQAFLRMQAIDPEACFNQLCALEGAVQNLRWHDLSGERKVELKVFLKMSRKAL